MKNTTLAGFALAIGLSTAAHAETVLRLASVAPAASPWGVWATNVAEQIATASDGALRIDLLLDAQAGDEQTIIRQATRGRIDIAMVSNAAMTLLAPEISVLSTPYVFDSIDQGTCVMHEHLNGIIGEMMVEAGVQPLTWMEVGNYVIFARDAVANPGDFQGTRLRVAPSIADSAFGSAIGASAVPLGTSDTIPALQTGAVDAATFPAVFGIAIGTHRVAPNVLVTNHARLIGTVAISQRVWEGLSDQEREWLGVFGAAGPAMTQAVLGAELALLGQLEGAGVPVHRLSAEEEALWRAENNGAGAAIVAEAGGRAAEIMAALEAAKAACVN